MTSSLPRIMHWFIAPFFALILHLPAMSQSQSDYETRLDREARFQSFTTLKRYQQYHKLDTQKITDRFRKLFAENATHTLDIPLFNQNGQDYPLAIDDYIESYTRLFGKSAKNSIEIIPLHFLSSSANGVITIEATCTKRFKGKAIHPKDTLEIRCMEEQHLLVTIEVKNGQELIEYWKNPIDENEFSKRKPKLDLSITSVQWSPLQDPYYLALVDKKGSEQIEVLCGQSTTMIDSNLVLLKGEDTWVVRDKQGERPDTRLKAVAHAADADPVDILKPFRIAKEMSRRPWSLHLTTGLVGSSTVTLTDPSGNNATWEGNGGTSAQLGLGYALRQNKNHSWDITFSGAFNQADYTYLSSDLNYSTDAIDPDGMEYMRITTAQDWQESLSEQTLAAEGSMLSIWQVNPQESKIGWWLGARYGYSYGLWSQTSFNASAALSHSGYYAGLYGITIDEKGIYDFGAQAGQGNGESTWAGFSQHSASAVIGLQFKEHPAWLFLCYLGGVYLSRSNDTTDNVYVQGTDVLNSGVHQSGTFTYSTWHAGISLRKRLNFRKLNCEEDKNSKNL